jgi:hypothetical protein
LICQRLKIKSRPMKKFKKKKFKVGSLKNGIKFLAQKKIKMI